MTMMKMRTHNNSRLPSFILAGLIIALALVAYSYWSVSKKNSNLLTVLDEKLIELEREKAKRYDLKKSLGAVELKLTEFADTLDKEKGESSRHEKSWNNCKTELSNTLLQVDEIKAELTAFETKINEATDLIHQLKEREGVQAVERTNCNTALEDEKAARETDKQQALATCEQRLNDQRLLILQHVSSVAGPSVIFALQQRGVDTIGVQLEQLDTNSSHPDNIKAAKSEGGVTQAIPQLQQTSMNVDSRVELAEIAYGHPDPMQGFQYQPLLRKSNNVNISPSSTGTATTTAAAAAAAATSTTAAAAATDAAATSTSAAADAASTTTAAAVNGGGSIYGRRKFPKSDIVVRQRQHDVGSAAVKTSTTTGTPVAPHDDTDYDEDDKDEKVNGVAANAAPLPSSAIAAPLPRQPDDEETTDETGQPAGGDVDSVKDNDGDVDPDDDLIDRVNVKDAETVNNNNSIDPVNQQDENGPVKDPVGPEGDDPEDPVKDDDGSIDIAGGRLLKDNSVVDDVQQ